MDRVPTLALAFLLAAPAFAQDGKPDKEQRWEVMKDAQGRDQYVLKSAEGVILEVRVTPPEGFEGFMGRVGKAVDKAAGGAKAPAPQETLSDEKQKTREELFREADQADLDALELNAKDWARRAAERKPTLEELKSNGRAWVLRNETRGRLFERIDQHYRALTPDAGEQEEARRHLDETKERYDELWEQGKTADEAAELLKGHDLQKVELMSKYWLSRVLPEYDGLAALEAKIRDQWIMHEDAKKALVEGMRKRLAAVTLSAEDRKKLEAAKAKKRTLLEEADKSKLPLPEDWRPKP